MITDCSEMDDFLQKHSLVASSVDRLSGRQRQCMLLVRGGLTSKEIGRSLNLSPSTVDNHIQAVVERLNVKNRGEAARILFPDQPKLVASEQPVATGFDPDRDDRKVTTSFPDDDNLRLPTWLPPLGGQRNILGAYRRFMFVAQIALMGTMSLAALTVTIAGIVHLFKR